MKTLKLQEILFVVEGRLVSGNESQLIKNAAKYGEHLITDHTLVFVMKNKKYTPLPTNVSSITVITSNPDSITNVPKETAIVQVSNVRKAYYRFIRYYRQLFNLPVIGVTGTCGKTTTKEMISWILSDKQNVVSTLLSHNGLRRNLDYLLEIDDTTDSAVFEMGVSGPDQLLYSAHYFQPQIGIITTIGTDHTEGFRTQELYIKEKVKMLSAVGQRGTIILNYDDKNIRNIDVGQFKGTVIYYGTTEAAHIQAHTIKFNLEREGMDFLFVCREGKYPCFVPGFGTHNVYNALAAIIASTLAGVKLTDAIQRLQTFKHVKSHLQFHKGIKGSLIIDDTWNTNPTSIESALEVLKETSQGRKKIAVIGEIEELGDYSVSEHEKVGSLVVKNKVDVLITVGKNTLPACKKAAELGMNPSAIHNVTNKKELYNLLNTMANEHTSILLKTSMRKSFQDLMDILINRSKKG